MNPPVYLHEQDAAIGRASDSSSGIPASDLYDCDGEFRFHFPPGWTDEQIHHAIRFANKAFEQGYQLGDLNARYQIRAALGIEPRA